MEVKDMVPTPANWVQFTTCWSEFCDQYKVLGLTDSYNAAHNFLRRNRDALLAADVLRRVNGRHWIADSNRFSSFAFDLLTGAQE